MPCVPHSGYRDDSELADPVPGRVLGTKVDLRQMDGWVCTKKQLLKRSTAGYLLEVRGVHYLGTKHHPFVTPGGIRHSAGSISLWLVIWAASEAISWALRRLLTWGLYLTRIP